MLGLKSQPADRYTSRYAMNFQELHRSGTFLLINVHNAGAARIAEAAGAVALGTTSSGHAGTLARRDGVGAVSRSEALRRAEQICAAVQIPVSIDAENGWGHEPESVAQTIRDLADVGAAGASIEDWSSDTDIGLYELTEAAERITAAVEAADSLDRPFVVCARAEGFLYGRPTVDDILSRLKVFAQAGAHCVYAPGTQELAVLQRLVDEAGAPLNALIPIGSKLTIADAGRIGVRRVSLGGSMYRATMATFEDLVTQLLTDGTFGTQRPPIPTSKLEALFET